MYVSGDSRSAPAAGTPSDFVVRLAVRTRPTMAEQTAKSSGRLPFFGRAAVTSARKRRRSPEPESALIRNRRGGRFVLGRLDSCTAAGKPAIKVISPLSGNNGP